MNYIFAAPNMAAAYFALFQKLNGYMIFDPLNNKDDVKCFGAVATKSEQCLSSCRTVHKTCTIWL